MSQIKGNSLAYGDLFTSSTTQGENLGAYVGAADGRGYRYVLTGAQQLVPGTVQQAPAVDATNYNPVGGLAVGAAAVGAIQITLTGSLTLAANALQGGFMSVAVTPGQGYIYKVKGNTAVTAATGCVVTLEDPLLVALTTSSKVIFQLNPYSNIIQVPSTMTNIAVGVASYPIAANQYGWLQTKGPASCLIAGAVTNGIAVGVLQGGTVGALAAAIAGTPIIGHMMGLGTSGEYDLVNLTLN